MKKTGIIAYTDWLRLTFTEHGVLVDANLVARDDQGVQGQPCQDRNDDREHNTQSKATLSVLFCFCFVDHIEKRVKKKKDSMDLDQQGKT